MRAVRLSTVALLIAFSVSPLRAQSLPPISTEMAIGVLNNKAQEFVYNPNGSVLSRLDWKTNDAVMLNTHTTMRLYPWLTLGLKGSTNLSGNAKMDDFDFDLVGCPASTPGHTECHSNSPTKLRQAMMFDIYASGQFAEFSGFRMNALAGYKADFYRWQAFGGTANYLTPPALPPGVGISYEQNWTAPYLGLGGSWQTGSWSLNGRVIGSLWAKGDDRDQHHLRSLLFTEDFGRSTFIGADVGVGYRLSQSASLTLNYGYQNWQTAKGPTTTSLGPINLGTTNYDAGGGNNVSHMVSLGVKIDLNPVDGGSSHHSVSRPASWSGFYAGANAGYDWQRVKWETTALQIPATPPDRSSARASLDDQGSRGGVFAGYAWQTGQMIWGVEADIGRSNANATYIGVPGVDTRANHTFYSDAAIATSGWDGSLRARIGMAVMPALMLYGTGGLAIQQIEARLSCPGASGFLSWCVADRDETVNKIKLGYTLGVGYEYQYAGNWFTRGEYRYTNTGSFDHQFFANAPIDTVSTKIDTSSQHLTFGIGYRF